MLWVGQEPDRCNRKSAARRRLPASGQHRLRNQCNSPLGPVALDRLQEHLQGLSPA